MSSNRFGPGESPSARRRARRRRLSGLDPTPPSPPNPGSAAQPPARAPGASKQPEQPRQGRPLFEWRGWDSVVTYVILAAMLVGVITGLHRLLAAGILVLGASALAWCVSTRPRRSGRCRRTPTPASG